MNNATYKRLTAEAMRGLTVEALIELRNGYAVVPMGTKLTIVGKRGGLELESFPCELCGIKARFHGVHPGLVHVLVTVADGSSAGPARFGRGNIEKTA